MAVGDESCKVYLFVATLGYSRRLYVQAFRHERQTAWFDGLEGAFRHFGGIAEEVVFNERLHAFSRYSGFRPRACAPYRARTKGKDERGVGYVKRKAIAGRRFGSWAELEGHLVGWMREIADLRVHGTTGEVPLERFEREEASALRPRGDRPSFPQTRELTRRVQSDSCVGVDTNHYSVPWRLIDTVASVLVSDGVVRVSVAGEQVARHDQRRGRRERAIVPGHLAGIVGHGDRRCGIGDVGVSVAPPPLPAELLRPLAEYELVAGGRW